MFDFFAHVFAAAAVAARAGARAAFARDRPPELELTHAVSEVKSG